MEVSPLGFRITQAAAFTSRIPAIKDLGRHRGALGIFGASGRDQRTWRLDCGSLVGKASRKSGRLHSTSPYLQKVTLAVSYAHDSEQTCKLIPNPDSLKPLYSDSVVQTMFMICTPKPHCDFQGAYTRILHT